MELFISPLTNAIEALKSEFLADSGKIRPEFVNLFLSKASPMSSFQSLVALNKNKIGYLLQTLNFWCHEQEFLISWTQIK